MTAGLDTNIICYSLDDAYPEHEKLKNLLLDLSPENKVAVNPTVIHEAYHVLVFTQKWLAARSRRRPKSTAGQPQCGIL